MSLNMPYWHPMFGRECAAILRAFWWEGGFAAALAQMRLIWGNPSLQFGQAPTDMAPAYAVAEYDDTVVHLFAGCSQLSHARAVPNGYRRPNTLNVPADVNMNCLAIGDNWPGIMTTMGVTKTKRQLLIGHSYGGMIASVIGLGFLALPTQFGTPEVVTFGTPKIGTAAAATAARPLRLQRWMNEGDPVPYIWPSFSQAPELAVIMGYLATVTANYLVQWHGGTVLRADGTYYAADLPPTSPNWFTSDLIAWYNSLGGDPQHPHHLNSYYGRLETWGVNNPQAAAANPVATTEPQQRPPRPTLHEMQQQGAPIEEQFVDAPTVASGRAGPVREKVFRHAKVNDMHVVYWSDLPVCAFKHRTLAKKMVAGGNKMVNNYLRSPIGDPLQLEQAAQNFIGLMSLELL